MISDKIVTAREAGSVAIRQRQSQIHVAADVRVAGALRAHRHVRWRGLAAGCSVTDANAYANFARTASLVRFCREMPAGRLAALTGTPIRTLRQRRCGVG